jgi:hypothetical protein
MFRFGSVLVTFLKSKWSERVVSYGSMSSCPREAIVLLCSNVNDVKDEPDSPLPKKSIERFNLSKYWERLDFALKKILLWSLIRVDSVMYQFKWELRGKCQPEPIDWSPLITICMKTAIRMPTFRLHYFSPSRLWSSRQRVLQYDPT